MRMKKYYSDVQKKKKAIKSYKGCQNYQIRDPMKDQINIQCKPSRHETLKIIHSVTEGIHCWGSRDAIKSQLKSHSKFLSKKWPWIFSSGALKS